MKLFIVTVIVFLAGFWFGYEIGSAPIRDDWE